MKHLLTPFLLLFTCGLHAQQYIEDFDSYNVGDGIAETGGDFWIIWESDESTGEDAFISDEQALSGDKSLKLESDILTGGPQDVVLRFGDEGAFEATFHIYVPEGQSGYYNFQENAVPGTDWAFECVLDSTGLAIYEVDEVPILTSPYTVGEWVKFTHRLSTEADVLQLLIDDVVVGQFPYDGIEFGGINFYAAGDGIALPTYYIDDINVSVLEEFLIVGCMDSTACTYDEAAEIESSASCSFPGDDCNDNDNSTINDEFGEDCTCAGEPSSVNTFYIDATIAPNPAHDLVRVQANLNEATIRVMSLDGKVVFEDRRNNLSSGTDVQLNLNDGLYLLEVTEGLNRTTQRLVIQH